MRLALIGRGKLGSVIEAEALDRGYELSSVEEADLVIDSSVPSAVLSHVQKVLSLHKPLIIATTGWERDRKKVEELCQIYDGTILYSPNFSFGYLALCLLFGQIQVPQGFSISVEEVHDETKKDAPSGTAKSICKWLGIDSGCVSFSRVPTEESCHRIRLESSGEVLLIEHHSKGRKVFADGILDCIDKIKEIKGIWSLEQLLLEKRILC